MRTPSLRHKIREHLRLCKDKMKNKDKASMRYACIELRMAIEYLAYDKLSFYTDQLPYDITRKWQPGKVIKAISEIDPYVEKNSIVSFCIEKSYGVPDGNWISMENRSFTRKWVSKVHNTLGHFLHAPTLDRISEEVSVDEVYTKIDKIITEVEDILSSTLYNYTLGRKYTFDCLENCGAKIIRNEEGVPSSGEISCPNPDCGAIHIVINKPGDKFEFYLKINTWTCPTCKTTNEIKLYKIKRYPYKTTCNSCKTAYLIDKQIVLTPINAK